MQLAKCWKLRASGTTSRDCHTLFVGLPVVVGDNVSGADNQQERPVAAQWVVGFVDGEGCFSVSVFRNRTCALGWQCQPEFAVVQGARSVQVLHLVQQYFACGSVGRNGRHDNHTSDMYRYRVSRLADLAEHVVPFFEAHPLRTAKADDFAVFASVVQLMQARHHRTMDGLLEIARLAQTMNRRRRLQLLESSEAIRQPPRFDE